ncbi:hypothetical protein [Rhizobium sp. NXC24]|uniref:hypothetical protein n=1 Tax=Rhizobium sp. NXC24 TaxID=2048897 RepID=UPI000CDF50BD|nr:hypothetical protein [Rhizobium sp. NXC24]AVA23692.1 hypothetical protein NXC24_PA00044 [Rhizobium sp. NXC24]
MGTSKTSNGPGKNVPLVPNWVNPDSPPPPPREPLSPPPLDGTPSPPKRPPEKKPDKPQEEKPDQPPAPQLAPARRFTSARRAIGNFTKTGDTGNLRSALGNYVRSGYGGANTATQRMGRSTSAAGGVFDILSPDGTAVAGEPRTLDLGALAGLSTDEIAERIADAVNPADVSLDDAGVREAVAEAVSSVLSEHESADITALPTELVEECYIRTLSISTFNILIADIGASLQRAAHGNAGLANDRLKEISDWVREEYSAQYTKFKSSGGQLTKRTATSIARDITAQVMDIFESYLE